MLPFNDRIPPLPPNVRDLRSPSSRPMNPLKGLSNRCFLKDNLKDKWKTKMNIHALLKY